MLLDLPEIEPAPELCLRVMEQLNEQVPEQGAVREPKPGFVSPLVQQLLKNLSVLLACVGLLASIRADVSAYRLTQMVMSPRIINGLSAPVPTEQPAMLIAMACLLLLLSLKAGPRPDQEGSFTQGP
jgi:hypothetical protein